MPICILILIIYALVVTGCSDVNRDSRLMHISGIVSDSPNDALSMLDSIDYNGLSEADRHYFDLLSIKAADKAYVRHTSDSLVLDVIGYYASDGKDGLYPEALYYGGRVYSDLGDLPSALRYFQDALDALPENAGDDDLRGRILSQTGRLLNKLRLYEEAVPYIESTIGIDRNLNDTLNEVYDLQLLGTVYLKAHDFVRADSCFRTAIWKSGNMPASHRAKSSMHVAGVKYRLGQIDSALMYVRNVPDLVTPVTRNNALAIAADIYYAAGIMDTAYLYAHELVNSPDRNNKKTGYWLMLSPELRGRSHPDSLSRYLSEYLLIQEWYYNENENHQAVMQQSAYNYQVHERERQRAEHSNMVLRQCLLVISILLLLMGILVLFLKNRNASARLAFHSALENIERLRQSIDKSTENNGRPEDEAREAANDIPPEPVGVDESITDLREQLRSKLYGLYERSGKAREVASDILDSDAYRELVRLVSVGEVLSDDSPLWKDIEDTVLDSSPYFLRNLSLLVGGRLSSYDIHTALLIKCGIQPAQMSRLLNRTKGTISSRRESLCVRVFDEKLGTKVIDGIISLL